MRIRNATRLAHPLGSGPWHIVGSEEFFFNLNDAGIFEPGFAENRLFLGTGRPLGARFRLEGGYQMRYIELPARDLIQHTLLLTLFFDANLHP